MKNLILLLFGFTLLSGCSMDDEGQLVTEYAQVTNVDFPPFFEVGTSYDLEVTYRLPTGCHTAVGIDVFRVASSGSDKREIYIAGVVSYSPGGGECSRSNTDPVRKEKFTLLIDETQPYNFYLFQRQNSNNQAEYEKITVRVGDPGERDTE